MSERLATPEAKEPDIFGLNQATFSYAELACEKSQSNPTLLSSVCVEGLMFKLARS